MRKKIIVMSIAGAVAAISVAGARSVQAPELFEVPQSRASNAMPAHIDSMVRDGSAKWAAHVGINKKALLDGERELMLSMPEGPRLRMSLARSYRTARGEIVWSGADQLTADGRIKLDGEAPSTALFIVRGDRVTGQIITASGNVYEITTSEDGAQQVMVKRDPASLESKVDDTPNFVGIPTQRAAATADFSTRATAATVRILQVYTPEAVTQLGGQQAALDRAAFFIAQSNTVFTNNGLLLRFESAGVSLSTQGQGSTTDGTTLVNRIRITNDGFWDSFATTTRDSTRADLVALVTRSDLGGGTLCGQAAAIGATASTGFFVQNQACTTFTFVHEAGHLFGARHDNDPTLTPFAYGHGFVNAGGNFRTVMAVSSNPQPRIGYFSTDDQTFNGGSLGNATRADNERVMDTRGPTMAAFR
jgi:peptidyl-Asp metalloendopeptidase